MPSHELEVFWLVIRQSLEGNCRGYTWFAAMHGAIRARDLSRVLSLADSLAGTAYSGAAEHFAANQIAALIKKYPFPNPESLGLRPREAAMEKFLASEHRCKWINRRFRARRARSRSRPYQEFLWYASEWIRKVLGDEPDLKRIYDLCDFSSGASIGVHGNATNLGRKLSAISWSCTPSALTHAIDAIWSNDQMKLLILGGEMACYDKSVFTASLCVKVDLVSYNKISFVPKTAKTFRTIAVEPLLNGFVEKGVDQYMRECLARNGLDLSYQEPNQFMALQGSRGGFNPYATIDLSSASDSVSTELVRELLPPAWFDFLNQIRSPSYMLDQCKPVSYEKFVSMGNGFCFPLETLIFAALARSVHMVYSNPVDLRVYGDDIIVRQSMAAVVIEILDYCGFKTNTDKTFIFGPFRESCGADWYEGQDVRPVYWDSDLTDIREVFALHNSMNRSDRCKQFFAEVQAFLRVLVPPAVCFMKPHQGPGDTAFAVELDTFMGSRHARWNRFEQRWSWTEVQSRSIRDVLRIPSAPLLEYLAILRGSSSDIPLALRRLTRAVRVKV